MGTHPIFESDFDCLTVMSGSSWSLGLVEPVVAFLTGLFFGYSIWAKKSIPNTSGKSRLENDGTLNLDDDEEWETDESSDEVGDDDDEVVDVVEIGEEYKMVLCVRMDLKMGKGKMCAQCGHAAVGALKRASKRIPRQLKQWENYGQPKIALKVPNEDDMEMIKALALSLNLNYCVIKDAGRTQIAPGSKTVL